MAIERTVVIIILSLIGLIIVLFLIIYFYNYPKRYVDYLNISQHIKETLGIFLLCSRKRGNTMSFFIFLILAIIVIIAVALLYYLSYKQIILVDVTNKTEGLINETTGT